MTTISSTSAPTTPPMTPILSPSIPPPSLAASVVPGGGAGVVPEDEVPEDEVAGGEVTGGRATSMEAVWADTAVSSFFRAKVCPAT